MRIAPALLSLIAGIWCQAQVSREAGHVTALATKTTVSRGIGRNLVRTAAAKGAAISWNDVLETDRSGRVRIVLDDGSILTLGSESRLQVVKHDAAAQQTYLELKYGRIRAQIAKITRSGGSFELRTQTAVAGVIGTDFGADDSQPGMTNFVCLSGITRIYTLDKSSYVDCGPGMTVTTVSGEQLATPHAATPQQTERWRHITEPGDPLFEDTVKPAGPEQIRWHGLDVSGNWRLRPEVWGWFDGGNGNNQYAFVQSIFRLNLGQQSDHWGWHLQLAQPSLLGLPANAIAPLPQGQLGLGGTYFAANGASQNAASIFPSQAYVRFNGVGGGNNEIVIGRFSFVDGTETVPKDPTLAALKSTRIAHRLLGDFAFSVTGRSEDGVSLSFNPGKANLTFAAARPTRGVFQVDGLGEIDIAWEYGALTVPVASGKNSGELRVFGLGYQDVRAVLKTDNRPLAMRGGADELSNINLGTIGFDYLHAVNTASSGTFDFLVWAAGQSGSWGLQRDRAGAVAVESGWQPPAVAWRPWLRAGYFISSGDGNPNDNVHNTFFAVLPTPRIYARFPYFNEMNNTDAFGMLVLRPSPRITARSDVHWLWLTSGNDLWYQGGGAFQPQTFGYTGRSGLGARGLGTMADTSVDLRMSRNWALGFYYSHVWGGGVERNIYPLGSNANFGYVESTFTF